MPIAKYANTTFEGQVFQLEECYFVNCVLRQCHVFYSGGSYMFENTTFQDCQWTFQNQANQTCQLLTLIGLIPPGQAPRQQVQATGGGGLPN